MRILTPRMMAMPVLLLALIGVGNTSAAPSASAASAIRSVGLSIQFDFGHRKYSHHSKHQRHRQYNRYGHGYYRNHPYYDGDYKQGGRHGWSKHRYARKHRRKHHQDHRWYSYN